MEKCLEVLFKHMRMFNLKVSSRKIAIDRRLESGVFSLLLGLRRG